MAVAWYCRLERYSTSHKMIWWQRTYLFWTVIHVYLYGLDKMWTQKYVHKLWALERYVIISWFSVWRKQISFFLVYVGFIKLTFLPEISRTWHSNGKLITRNTTLCDQWRKWAPIFHQVLHLGFCKNSRKPFPCRFVCFLFHVTSGPNLIVFCLINCLRCMATHLKGGCLYWRME